MFLGFKKWIDFLLFLLNVKRRWVPYNENIVVLPIIVV